MLSIFSVVYDCVKFVFYRTLISGLHVLKQLIKYRDVIEVCEKYIYKQIFAALFFDLFGSLFMERFSRTGNLENLG